MPNTRALGIKWDVSNHMFLYLHNSEKDKGLITKMIMLGQLSSVYDPLGLIGPIIFKGKSISQKATWDESLNQNISNKWRAWLDSLKGLCELKFPRCICSAIYVGSVAELHHFSDASQLGFAACSYIRFFSGQIHVVLVASKSRLATLKQITIPRLKLFAAVLAVKLDETLKCALNFDLLPSTFWIDSEIVLAYIKSETKRFKVFVGNRVSLIGYKTHPSQSRHVKSQDNAADILSRGCSLMSLSDSWVSGPRFLCVHESEWPVQDKLSDNSLQVSSEVKRDKPHATVHLLSCDSQHPLDKFLNYHSSFYKLKMAVAVLVRVKEHLKKPKEKHDLSSPLTQDEMNELERIIIIHVQTSAYENDISVLKSLTKLKASSPIRKLDPVLNDQGLLVVGGRLKHTKLSLKSKLPV